MLNVAVRTMCTSIDFGPEHEVVGHHLPAWIPDRVRGFISGALCASIVFGPWCWASHSNILYYKECHQCLSVGHVHVVSSVNTSHAEIKIHITVY